MNFKSLIKHFMLIFLMVLSPGVNAQAGSQNIGSSPSQGSWYSWPSVWLGGIAGISMITIVWGHYKLKGLKGQLADKTSEFESRNTQLVAANLRINELEVTKEQLEQALGSVEFLT